MAPLISTQKGQENKERVHTYADMTRGSPHCQDVQFNKYFYEGIYW